MGSERKGPPTGEWERIDRIFQAALEQPAAARRSWVEAACAGAPELRDAVLELLATEERSERLFDHVARQRDAMVAATFDHEHTVDLIGKRIGVYRLEALLGTGGMGAVYRAERDDGEFRQTVAIKILPGWATDPQSVARLRAERQFLSGLRHPNITRLLDGGQTGDGYPYLVTEFIDGVPVTVYVHDRALGLRERLELFMTIADAVRHAHDQGIVHRDLKPANVLVDREGHPHLLDFGIATLQDGVDGDVTLPRTVTGFSPMTPGYSSPEQQAGQEAGTASDIYQLGLLLYEIVTGRRPLPEDPGTRASITRPSLAVRSGHAAAVTDDDEAVGPALPLPPGTWAGALKGDVDTIVMKALRAEPADRYDTVAAMMEDLRRHLDGEPILARPESILARGWRRIRHNPTGAVLAPALMIVLIAWVVGTREARVPVAGDGDPQAASTPSFEAMGTGNLEAFRAYERGRALLDQRNPDTMFSAIENFERALELDPAYALAWVGLADSLLIQVAYLQATDTNLLARADTAITRALELDPELAEAWSARGTLAYLRRDAPAALAAFDRALELNPEYASTWTIRAYQLGLVGRFEEAHASANRAVELDPLSAEAFVNLSGAAAALGRSEEAMAAARRARQLSPGWPSTQFAEAQAAFMADDFASTLDLLEGLEVPWAGAAVQALRFRSLLAVERRDEADTLLTGLATGDDRYAHAVALAALGDLDAAYRRLAAMGPFSEFASLSFQGPDRSLWNPRDDDSRYAEMLRQLHAAWGFTRDDF